ncbi:hypothetical protein [Agromyces lapidis]|uniref:Uncharacterized protein n=1 Tax=Agromyces lapidis TaxID=279574 RepID=A0ABV5SVT7_9MICO|nr:hypothetical protein [Agromyces lapidis]
MSAVVAARVLLVAAGLVFVGVGGAVMLTEVPPERYLGIAVWVGAAIVVHDAVIAPVVVAVGLGAGAVRDRLGRRAVAVGQGALLVGAVLTAIALPAIIAQERGNANPTVLVGSYALVIVIVWAVVAAVLLAVTSPAIGRMLRRARRAGRSRRPARPVRPVPSRRPAPSGRPARSRQAGRPEGTERTK